MLLQKGELDNSCVNLQNAFLGFYNYSSNYGNKSLFLITKRK